MVTKAIDFDGVIHKYSRGWQDGLIYDEPVEGALEGMKALVDAGFKVVIFTTRLSKDANGDKVFELEAEVRAWLMKHGFEWKKHFHEITGEKPLAVEYWDDRGRQFTNWKDNLSEMLK